MKKRFFLMLAMVLALSMLVACGRDRQEDAIPDRNDDSRTDNSTTPSDSFTMDDFDMDSLVIDERLIGRWYMLGISRDDVFVDADDLTFAAKTWIFFEDGTLLYYIDYEDWEFTGDDSIQIQRLPSRRLLPGTPFEIIDDNLYIDLSAHYIDEPKVLVRRSSFIDMQDNDHPLIGKWEIVSCSKEPDTIGATWTFFSDGKVAIPWITGDMYGETYLDVHIWGVGGANGNELFTSIAYPHPDFYDNTGFFTYHGGFPFQISGDRLYIINRFGYGSTAVFQKITS